MSAAHTPGPAVFVIKNAFGVFEVGFDGEGAKNYRVNVAGSSVSAWCEYPIETARSRVGRGLAAIGTRRVKHGTPLFTRLESAARAAIAKATGEAS